MPLRSFFYFCEFPVSLDSIHLRSGDGPDGRRQIGGTPAGGGGGTTGHPANHGTGPPPSRPDEGLGSGLGRTIATIAFTQNARLDGWRSAPSRRRRKSRYVLSSPKEAMNRRTAGLVLPLPVTGSTQLQPSTTNADEHGLCAAIHTMATRTEHGRRMCQLRRHPGRSERVAGR